jgi:DNA-binding SARP family transcriptional activator/Tfp pilus assembly protein PilF
MPAAIFALPGTATTRKRRERAFGQARLMRFRVLGPLEVWSEGDWTDVSAAKWRSLLACLLIRAGQIVSTDSLIFELWGDNPPARANNLVSIYVHRLRKLIGDTEGRVLVYRAPGYLLRVGADDTDMQQFEALVAEGRGMLDGDAEAAAARLGKALALWRGPLLADVSPSELVTRESERAAELQLAATELWVEANLACGRFAQVIPELRRLVAESPLREGLWLQLMRALEGVGRHAEALEAYGQAREAISEELGVDPGAELQRLYAELLAADASGASRPAPPRVSAETGVSRARVPEEARRPGEAPGGGEPYEEEAGEAPVGEVQGTIAIGTVAESREGSAGPATPAEPVGSPVTNPAQLPADIGDFTGRDAQVRHLCDMLTSGVGSGSPGAVRVAVIAGAGGLGKTTLAVHAAHRVRASFPDGQLYVDLLGASAQSASPGEVLARFLRDLGVPGDKVPVGDEERAALYRTRLTGRRVLILLDNVKDAAQVRPLLPGSASCAVLVTTRNRTPDLASTRFVDLNVLSDTEALALFTKIVEDDRPTAEPDATAEVLVACAGLPLAIRICAARLAARRQWKIATMANRLRDERRRLDELHVGDLEVRASFQVSYDSLRPGRHGIDPAHAFRLLGLWQGATISLPAAAALIGEAEGDVADVLETLVDANLLESPAPDRYRFHDLLRFYAGERAQVEESEADRAEAIGRLLRWYLDTADSAAQVIAPYRYRIPPESSSEAVPLPLATVDDALEWYDSERANVIPAARQASVLGMHDIAWRLPPTLFPLFNRRHNFADCITANRIAVDSARAAGHRQGEAWALQNLGQALAKIRDKEALASLEHALAIRRETGDRTGEAQIAVSLANAYRRLQGPEVALEHSQQYLEVLREVGNAALLGMGVNNHGEFCLELGRLDEAAKCFREAYDIWKSIGGYGQGFALHNLGQVHLRSGQLDDAIECLTSAYRIHQASGDLLGQAHTLSHLVQAYRENGDEQAAQESTAAALAILESLKEDSEVADIYAMLAPLRTLVTNQIQEGHLSADAVSGPAAIRSLRP